MEFLADGKPDKNAATARRTSTSGPPGALRRTCDPDVFPGEKLNDVDIVSSAFRLQTGEGHHQPW